MDEEQLMKPCSEADTPTVRLSLRGRTDAPRVGQPGIKRERRGKVVCYSQAGRGGMTQPTSWICSVRKQ